MAIQKARILSSLVISEPTVRISFGPYNARPKAIPMSPTIITHTGILALLVTPPLIIVSLFAASGPTALATSLAPWAKLKKAAAHIRGRVKRRFTLCFSLENLFATLASMDFTNTYKNAEKTSLIKEVVAKSTFQIYYNPLSNR